MTEETRWLKVRIPTSTLDLLRAESAQRKADGEKPDTIQGMVTLGLQRYLSAEGDSERLKVCFQLLRQAAVDLRHFGFRDFGTKLLKQAVKLGADPDLSSLEGTGGDTTRRS